MEVTWLVRRALMSVTKEVLREDSARQPPTYTACRMALLAAEMSSPSSLLLPAIVSRGALEEETQKRTRATAAAAAGTGDIAAGQARALSAEVAERITERRRTLAQITGDADATTITTAAAQARERAAKAEASAENAEWEWRRAEAENALLLIALLTDYRLDRQPKSDAVRVGFVREKAAEAVLRLQRLRDEVHAETYTERSLAALQKAQEHIAEEIARQRQRKAAADARLAEFNIGLGFTEIVREYSDLRRKIRDRERALAHLTSAPTTT
jgi:vacuolar-type H+-ATPase subunit I/STV1